MSRQWKAIPREEWFTSEYAGDMLLWLRTASARKLRLFACAASRQVWHKLSDGGREMVLAAERWADDEINRNQLNAIRERHRPALTPAQGAPSRADQAALVVATPRKAALVDLLSNIAVGKVGPSNSEGLAAHAHHRLLLHDIFDHLFMDVAMRPEWRTPTVVGVAKKLYQEKSFDAMPILADALEDAGCDSEDILAHCRSGDLHVRGCWAVDQIVEKE